MAYRLARYRRRAIVPFRPKRRTYIRRRTPIRRKIVYRRVRRRTY